MRKRWENGSRKSRNIILYKTSHDGTNITRYYAVGGRRPERPTWRPSGCGKKNPQEAHCNDCATSSSRPGARRARITTHCRTQCSPVTFPRLFRGGAVCTGPGRPLSVALLCARAMPPQCLGGPVPSVEPGPGDADTATAAAAAAAFYYYYYYFFFL